MELKNSRPQRFRRFGLIHRYGLQAGKRFRDPPASREVEVFQR
jgi:hypothetical protein